MNINDPKLIALAAAQAEELLKFAAAAAEADIEKREEFLRGFEGLQAQPDDLEWKTRRALKLLCASGIECVRVDVEDGQAVLSEAGTAIWHHWESDKGLSASVAGAIMNTFQLGGMTLQDLCLDVLGGWAESRKYSSAKLVLDPLSGVSASEITTSSGVFSEEEDLFAFDGAADFGDRQEPRFWVEWASDDWLDHGFVDFTDWASSEWAGESGTLFEVLEDGLMGNAITSELHINELDDVPDYEKALERMWTLEEQGKDLAFHQSEVAPHLFMYVMAHRYPRTVEKMRAWAEQAGYPKGYVEEALLRSLC